MGEGIFLIKDNDSLVEMKEQAYDSEDLLQDLLVRYPSLLAGDQIDSASPRRWLLVAREASVPGEEGGAGRWSVDHLFLDQDGIPTLVEVKRSSDTRIRREVLGQMLDYAANVVVYWPVETVRSMFEETCRRSNTEPDQVLSDFLGAEIDADGYWGGVSENLGEGRIRMLFVADVIPPELRRIVEFLNEQMDRAEVLAVEIRQFTGEGQKTLVPRVMGQTAEAERRKTKGTRPTAHWDEDSFFSQLSENCPPEDVGTARRILAWIQPLVTRIWWGRGAQRASLIPVLQIGKTKFHFFALYPEGSGEAFFQYLQEKAPFQPDSAREELRRRLNDATGLNLPPDGITRRPSFPLKALRDPGHVKKFQEAVEWAIKRVQEANPEP